MGKNLANFSQYESDSRILDKTFLCLVLWSEATVQGNEVLAFDDSLVFGFFANRDFDNAFDFTRTSVTSSRLLFQKRTRRVSCSIRSFELFTSAECLQHF